MTSQHVINVTTQRHQQSGHGDGREDLLADPVHGDGGVRHSCGTGVHLEDGTGHLERHPTHCNILHTLLHGEWLFCMSDCM